LLWSQKMKKVFVVLYSIFPLVIPKIPSNKK
jgi:hypothetical protein